MKELQKMKKVLAMAAAAALACGVSAFAANPFSDVSTSDWAYQAISQLSDQGMVEGYPDGTFKGQQNITRYEAAQIVARLLAREDQLNAEQKATVNKLAAEYADELENLGVRVTKLEKKVGNLRWNGDARMRYQQSWKGTTTNTKDKWDGRIRIGVTAAINDSTYAYGRLRTDMNFVKDTNSNGQQDDNTYMDRLFIHHQFGSELGVTLGRSELYMGSAAGSGLFFDNRFDGVRAKAGNDKLNLDLGYGRFKDWNDTVGDGDGDKSMFANTYPDAWYASVKGQVGAATLGADYIHLGTKVSETAVKGDKNFQLTGSKLGDDFEFWGLNLNIPVKDWTVFGDYYQNSGISGNPDFYTAGLAYGRLKKSKPGTFDLSLQYAHVDSGTYLGGTGPFTDPSAASFNPGIKSVKYWFAQGDVMLQKNVRLHVEYAFNVKGDKLSGGDANYKDLSSVSLNYNF